VGGRERQNWHREEVPLRGRKKEKNKKGASEKKGKTLRKKNRSGEVER